MYCFFFQAEDGIRDLVRSRGLGDVYKRQIENKGIIISTKTDPIILLEAKLEGKNISSKKQLIQHLKPSVGEYLSD